MNSDVIGDVTGEMTAEMTGASRSFSATLGLSPRIDLAVASSHIHSEAPHED
jgi:hypothetical protein